MDIPSFVAEVCRLARQAGLHVDQIQLLYHEKPVLVMPVPEGRPDPPEEGERGRTISQIPLDILAVLDDVGRPLTTTQLLAEMSKRRMEWSQSAVSTHLKAMMDDGTLENPPEARPRGYRLPS